MRLGAALKRRVAQSLALVAATAVFVVASANATASWDLSEARANSFLRPDEAVLARLGGPIDIDVHLATADPRRVDLAQPGLSKLRRVRPDVRVSYDAQTTTGLFEQTNPHYGEVWYRLQDKRVVTRAVTPESVLESIYEAAGVTAPATGEGEVFRGLRRTSLRRLSALPPACAGW